MKKHLNIIIFAVTFVASAVLTVISFNSLPPTVITQLSAGGGEPTTMPKVYAILVPAILSFGASFSFLFKSGSIKQLTRNIIISLIALGVFVTMLLVNV